MRSASKFETLQHAHKDDNDPKDTSKMILRLAAIEKKKNLKEFIDQKVFLMGRCDDVDYKTQMEIKHITKFHEKNVEQINRRRRKVEELMSVRPGSNGH